MPGRVLSVIVALLILYGVVMIVMYVAQRQLMYFPSRHLQAPAHYGLSQAQEVTLTTADQVAITAWVLKASPKPSDKALPLLVHLHGNAGSLADRTEVYAAYHAAGFDILALEWRGFGSSQGKPSEAGLYEDARAALAYAQQTLDYTTENILLYGESLGSAVAIEMATRHPFAAIVLEAPPKSIWQRAAEVYPWLPVNYLIKDRYDSLAKMAKVSEPLLIIHNKKDKIVPMHHGQALFEAAREPKEIKLFDHEGHVFFDRKIIAAQMKEFLRKHIVFRP